MAKIKALADIGTDTLKGKAVTMALYGAGVVTVANAAMVTAGKVAIPAPKGLGAPTLVTAEVRTSAGATKAWDGVAAYNATDKTLEANNAGTTDWAATDRVLIRAYWA